ncbi:MAG: hypothetical protein ACI37Q_08160 [Candidatus Gastranaerophilaceae bacterium]
MINVSGIGYTPKVTTKNNSNYNYIQAEPNFEGRRYNKQQFKPIGVLEGTKLLGKGIVKQVTSTISSIVENPLKTLAIIGGTTLVITSLPLIGIPAAVGGGALAIGFAGLALGKGAYHTLQFVKNNEVGTYDIARKNLEQIGGDTVDLALSAPFIPKALKNIQEFLKYGKFGYNQVLANQLQQTKGIINKFKVLKNANTELTRSSAYAKTVDAEVAKVEGITEAEAAKIKKDLLEFNVPTEKIPEVVLDKYAQIKGIKTKPNLNYRRMNPDTFGYANARECSINLNDGTQKTSTTNLADEFKTVKRTQKGNLYEYQFKDKKGNIVTDTIDKSLLDEFQTNQNTYETLSPQAREILTTVHEREHIDQFSRVFTQNPKGLNYTSEARRMYTEMAKERGALSPAEISEVNQYINAPNYHGKPFTVYLKDPYEINARKIEFSALNNPTFQKLDNIFKTVNATPINSDYRKAILLNVIRAQSATN